MTKKLTAFVASIYMILVLIAPKAFAASVVYSYIDTEDLSRGVTRSSYKLFMSDRTWNNAEVVKADLKEPHLALEVLSDPRGVSYLNTVEAIAKEYDTVAAVNSDFFSWGQTTGRGSPVGPVYSKGSLMSSPSNGNEMYTLAQSWDNDIFINMFQYTMTLVAPNGNRHVIKGLNKYDDLSGIMMYNKYWDSVSLDSTGTLHEMVVKDGIVKEIRFNSEPVSLDSDTYVLATLSDWNTFLIDNFHAGDKVTIEISSNINTSDITLAAGGGAQILQNGQIPSGFSHNPAGNNPRTAAGVDKSGRILYLVTVDGRQNNSRGMTLTELAEFMKSIGVYNAINLDGGGSTQMVAKNPVSGSQELVNTPSEKPYRKVSTVLGIKSDQPQDNNVSALKIIPDGDMVWVNSRIRLSLQAFNQYLSAVPFDQSKVNWSVSGTAGSFSDNEFRPTTSGIATVTAKYHDVSVSLQIKVLDRPYAIEHTNKDIYLNVGEAKDVWFWARDDAGYLAHIPITDMKVTLSGDVISLNRTAVIGKKPGSALVSVALGDAVTYFAVHVGGNNDQITLPDSKKGTDSANKTGTPLNNDNKVLRIAVFGNMREPNTLFNNLIMQRAMRALDSQADIAAYLSLYTTPKIKDNMTIPTITCETYGSFVKDGNTFIHLDTEDDFMSGKEWSWLMDELNALSTKNLFVFMPTNMKFTSDAESQLLKDILADTVKKGHEVYVFYNNWATAATPYDGVRYISTPGFSNDITPDNFVSINFKLRYILVDVDKSGNVSYRFNQLY